MIPSIGAKHESEFIRSVGNRNCSKYGSWHNMCIYIYNMTLHVHWTCHQSYVLHDYNLTYKMIYICVCIYICIYIYLYNNTHIVCMCILHTYRVPPLLLSLSPQKKDQNAKGTTASCHCSALPTLARFGHVQHCGNMVSGLGIYWEYDSTTIYDMYICIHMYI